VQAGISQSADGFEYKAALCLRADQGGCVKDSSGSCVVLRSPVQLPFTTHHNCYRVLCENEESINNTVSVFGFLDIKCYRDSETFKDILTGALTTLGVKGTGKKKLAGAMAGTAHNNETAFMNNVRREFKDTPDVGQHVSDAVRGLSGWFTKDTRALGAALFCMGFTDRALITHELSGGKDAAAEVAAWFRPLGDPDQHWKSVDDKYESFPRLLNSFAGRHAQFIQSIDAMISGAPEKFFSQGTRPMALRGLGAQNKTLFHAYCMHKLNTRTEFPDAFLGKKGAALCGDIFVTDGDALPDSSCNVNGAVLQRCAVNTLRSLSILSKNNMLLFRAESEVAQESRSMFDSSVVRPGVKGVLREVHVFCASSKICFVFDDQGTKSTDEAVRSFLCGKQPCKAKVYFRDAHILSCSAFAHVVSALAIRVCFESITMTHRFQHDREFRSILWCFMRHLEGGVATIDPAVGSRAEPLIKGAPLRTMHDAGQLTGICVVPMAKDAASALDAKDTDLSFCVSPPLLGYKRQSLAEPLSLDIRVYSSGRVVHVQAHSGTSGRKNVFACHKTDKGGFFVPASAFLAVRSSILANVNLLLPLALDEACKRELVLAALTIADKVTIVDVEQYHPVTDDDDDDDIKIAQIAKTIIDSC